MRHFNCHRSEYIHQVLHQTPQKKPETGASHIETKIEDIYLYTYTHGG